MKKILLASILLIALSFTANAQKWEVGLFGGGANYMGELSGDFIDLEETNPAVGGFVRYYVHPFINVRFGLTYGSISGADKTNAAIIARNLSFKSDVFEAALIPEINLIGWRDNHLFSPYIFGGIAVYNFNPKALYKGEWYELQPLGTEGQGVVPGRERYNLTQIAIPFGAGFKFGFTNGLNLGIEVGARKTFNDYLDDISTTYVDRTTLIFGNGQNGALSAALSNRTGEPTNSEPMPYDMEVRRGNPNTQDWYMFGGITVSYTLGTDGGGMGKNKKAGCPIY